MEPLLASIEADLAIAPLLRTTVLRYLQSIARDRRLPQLPKFLINMSRPPARQSEIPFELARHIRQEFQSRAYRAGRHESVERVRQRAGASALWAGCARAHRQDGGPRAPGTSAGNLRWRDRDTVERLGFDPFHSDPVQGRRGPIGPNQARIDTDGDTMRPLGRMMVALLAIMPIALTLAASSAHAEKRIALVIGNAGYQTGALTTPANDAGLIAQTLQAAGFDVAGARDLDQDSLRRAFRDFLEKATSAGPDTVAFIYVSGYGLQLEGENYVVPVDAKINRDADVAAEALRVSDYTRPLAALKLKAAIVVLDAARANQFARSGPPLAGGLALVEPESGLLMAFNAAPGTVAPEGQGSYGPYAQALAEMIRDGGLPLTAVFERARLRVNDVTKGAQVPWHASKVEASVVFFERAPDAPPPAVAAEQTGAIRSRPIKEFSPQEAYAAALDRDTLEGYSEFLTAYPDDPMAKRVRVIVAARREALTWRRTCAVNTPPAYWSYLRRYPQGPHAADAHRRLAFLSAAFEPPPAFTAMAYDLPPPPPEEIVYIRRPVLMFDDPVFAFAPPSPPPVIFLAPPPPEFVLLPPPPPPVGIFVLPMPIYRPVPVWVRPPVYVAPPPPNNVIYTNVHNTVVINNVTRTVTITNPAGQTQTVAPPAPQPVASSPGAAPAAPAPAAPGPALPPSVAQKAALQSPTQPAPGAPASATPPAGTQVPPRPGQPLPGMQGRPLPPATGTAVAPATAPGATAPTATAPGAPGSPPAGSVTPGSPPASATAPATKQVTPSPPPASTTAAPTQPPPGTAAKPATPSSPTPGATGAAPTTPSTATAPTAPPSAGQPKRASPPPHAPAAKLAPAAPPPNAAAPPPPSAAKPPAPPPPVGAAPPPPRTPPVAAKPPAPPPAPPPPAARPAAPPPPVARPAAPPPPAPAAAAARPAPPPPPAAPKVAPPQPKGCPPGKSMAVVNGQPVCK